jgi:hypothetical protein
VRPARRLSIPIETTHSEFGPAAVRGCTIPLSQE